MIHVCIPQCFCSVCGKHKVSKPSVPTATGYAMYWGCPDGHMIEKTGDVTIGSTCLPTNIALSFEKSLVDNASIWQELSKL